MPTLDASKFPAIVTGTPKGDLMVWRGGKAVRLVAGAHKPGPLLTAPDGMISYVGSGYITTMMYITKAIWGVIKLLHLGDVYV